MNALVSTAATMTSREIAELTGKQHAHVIRDIRSMLSDLEDDPNLDHVREDKDARGYTTEIILPKDLTLTLVAGYNAKLRKRIVDRWLELEAQPAALPAELSRLEILQLAIESEQGRIKAEAERDEAVRTKAQIGSRREAQAMAKASSAARQVKRLENELGRGAEQATITAVENAIGERFPRNAYVELRRWCKDNGTSPAEVHDDRYGTVKAWPAAAWLAVHGIDLGALFAVKQSA